MDLSQIEVFVVKTKQLIIQKTYKDRNEYVKDFSKLLDHILFNINNQVIAECKPLKKFWGDILKRITKEKNIIAPHYKDYDRLLVELENLC